MSAERSHATIVGSPSGIGLLDKADIVSDLLWLRSECHKRCIYETAQWAEECLANLPDEDVNEIEFVQDEKSNLSTMLEVKTQFIRSLIYNKEFHRAVYFAEKLPEPLNPEQAFLLYFSNYMVCLEKFAQKDPDKPDYGLYNDDPYASMLSRKIQLYQYKASPGTFDCWMYYLLGCILKLTDDEKKARQAFINAINLEPRCWPAWESLAMIVSDKHETSTYQLPNSWFHALFVAKVCYHVNRLRDALDVYDAISKSILGSTPYIIGEIGMATSTLQEHGSAVASFDLVHKIDPFRIEHMNHYADSLYIRSDVEKLYVLGRFYEKSHKYTWQSCAILANYFSSVKQHDRAHSLLVTATRLSPRNSPLWILLGHECFELKNPTDAVTAYRKALALDPQNYQAYYGLGQVYEIFGFPDFALKFYEQAHRFRPTDSRMLVAMGVAFSNLNRPKDAEMAYIKAFRVGDVQGNALKKLGKFYEEQKDKEKAAKAYTTFLKVYNEETHSDVAFVAQACLYLAQYFYDQGKFDKVAEYLPRCLDNDETKEGALKIQREIQLKNDASNVLTKEKEKEN